MAIPFLVSLGGRVTKMTPRSIKRPQVAQKAAVKEETIKLVKIIPAVQPIKPRVITIRPTVQPVVQQPVVQPPVVQPQTDEVVETPKPKRRKIERIEARTEEI